MAPLGALVLGTVVVRPPHPQHGALTAEGDVLLQAAGEQTVVRALEASALRDHLGALLEHDLLIADEADRVDDPGLAHVVDDELGHLGVDGCLQGGGGVGLIKAPPGGPGFLDLPGGYIVNGLLVHLAESGCRQAADKQCGEQACSHE